jgi:hypothetical protein
VINVIDEQAERHLRAGARCDMGSVHGRRLRRKSAQLRTRRSGRVRSHPERFRRSGVSMFIVLNG